MALAKKRYDNKNNKYKGGGNMNWEKRNLGNHEHSKDEHNIYMEHILSYIKEPVEEKKYELLGMEDGYIYKKFKDVPAGTQLRKFYTRVVEIDEHYKDTDKDTDRAKGDLASMIPIIYYSGQRGLLREKFYNFMVESIETLEGIPNEKFGKSLKAFRELFQAVIAYTKSGGN
jgi:CRISPR type III-A-associated protein Csm2